MPAPEAPPRADRLTALLQRFPLQAGVFHVGGLCGVHDFHRDTGRGHLHLVRRGPVRMIGLAAGPIDIAPPTLVLQALHQRPAQAWTLEQMAAFGRAFVRRVGMTPTAWMATPTGHGTLGPRGETLDQPD